MDELTVRQLLAELRRAGFYEARYSDEHDAIFPMDKEFPDIQLRQGEIWMPRIELLPEVANQPVAVKIELEHRLNKLVRGVFRPIADKVDEVVYLWTKAAPLTVNDDDEKYRLLSEFGRIVLAARDDGDYGLHFVTWEYSFDRRDVGHGHYTTDYEGAKKDFAIRSCLIQENELFAPEQLVQIYSALLFQGKNDEEITYSTEKELHAIIEKLESICPGLKDFKAQQEQEHEEEPELD